MSFATLSGCFLLGSFILFMLAVRLRRIRLRAVLPALGVAVAILFVLTAVFDNLMIYSGLFDYESDTLLGVHLGLAPIEDFTYPLAAVLFVPALWWLAAGRSPVLEEQD
ncbi:lycopene cyclase domain-containing protein [Paeniglutamicibacter antarcticus]|uniref:Lycopene cyclase domain-containing protein n=1 Tax=Paeniglutamicibacter antarcticus TaxID=494023 RepID=A0ABP9TN52_9MICC